SSSSRGISPCDAGSAGMPDNSIANVTRRSACSRRITDFISNLSRSFTVRTQFLPYCLPLIGEEEIQEVVESLRSGWVTMGPKVKRFEGAFADYVGAPHAIAVNSC